MQPIDLYNNAIYIDSWNLIAKKAFNYWCNKKHKSPIYDTLCFDTETTGIVFGEGAYFKANDKTVIKVQDVFAFNISLCFLYKDRLALVSAECGTELFEQVKYLLSKRGPKVAHNSRFDLKVGIVNNFPIKEPVNCTLTAARIIWNRRKSFGLKALTHLVCPELDGYDAELKKTLTNIKSSHTRAGYPKDYCNYSFIPRDTLNKYACIDVFITWLLNLNLMPEIYKKHKEVYFRERKIISIVKNTELSGVKIDRKQARLEIVKLKRGIPKDIDLLHKLAGQMFNHRSNKILPQIFLNNLKAPKKFLTKVDKGEVKISTDKEHLMKLYNFTKSKKIKLFIDTLKDLRAKEKLLNTYLKPLLLRAKNNRGIVCCEINPTDTVTGRMASKAPNLQNIPRPTTNIKNAGGNNPVRKIFVPRAGYINSYTDYSQMEIWLTAITCKEPKLIAPLTSGADIHATVAIQLFGERAFDDNGEEYTVLIDDELLNIKINKTKRTQCKKVNFGIICGMGFRLLAAQIGVTLMEAHEIIQDYFEAYPCIKEQSERNEYELKKNGYISDIFGRQYNIRPSDAYKGINAQVQGGCAQIMKIAIIKIYEYTKQFNKKLDKPHFSDILYIHDEIVQQFPKKHEKYFAEYLANVHYLMCYIPELLDMGYRLKVETEIAEKRWDEKHRITNNKILEFINAFLQEKNKEFNISY